MNPLFCIGRRLSAAYFFCILCAGFLNTSALAQSADSAGQSASKPKFVEPLILITYDSGTLITNMGGLSDGDETTPGVTFTTMVPDEGFTRGNSGYSLRLDFDVSNMGEYSFYWIKLGKETREKTGVTAALDLRGYNYLSFWMKGAQEGGNIKVEVHQDQDADGVFIFDKDIISYVYINGYINSGMITSQWQKVLIPLKDFSKITDWSKSLELVFVFENKTGNQKGTVYLDDVMFGYRAEDILMAKEMKELAVPLETTFSVNGADAKSCPAFGRVNRLEIAAEDINDNPFIEAVRFEYSIDNGHYRTIGTDYNVSKRNYRVDWHPTEAREPYNYKVRAVATDMRGNEKATAVLIECGVKPLTDDEFLNLVEKKAFDFFNEHQSPKTGLFADTSGGGDASIASTGFGLAALCIGAERGWVDREEARKRVILAINTFLPQKAAAPEAEGKYGFFYHFLNIHNGARASKSEISTVDTALLVAGALTAGEYFGGEVKEKAESLYKRVEWGQFLSKEDGPWKNLFSMGWSPERGFLESYWDYYTDEVVLISLLAIGSPTYPASADTFYAWTRHKGSYGSGKSFIYSWHGALFSYQYANCFFNFQGIVDEQGVNWFENSTNATLANRQFCIDNMDKFKGYGPNSWGITSMARPGEYTMHFGAPPAGNGEAEYDGAISPTGPAGSMVFIPYLSMSALKYMYMTYPKLWGQYGLRDSFNLDMNWYAPTYYGIGEAMILIPVENFRSGFIWNNFMKSRYVKGALDKAGFTKEKKETRR